MKYAVIKIVNGNFSVHAEGFTEVENAKVSFHGLCQSLWNEPTVVTACVAIIDENFMLVDNVYREYIAHKVDPEVEPETTSET